MPPDLTAGRLSPTDIRHKFSIEMSHVYRTEVPLYADLISLVTSVNDDFLASRPVLHENMERTKQLERLHYERHGAIRLGTPEEMGTMTRFLAIMGMQPVGYYDLTQPPARLPIHATCFRCLDLDSLSVNPFRLFVSLLCPESISESLRMRAFGILSRRQIFSHRCLELISVAERENGLTPDQANEFIREGLETFKWRGTATVSLSEYQDLQKESPLLADIVAFPGPHINHLTPRTLDIDEVQLRMEEQGIPVKEVIEGPPARKCPILLRQTSFKALKEGVYFPVDIGCNVLGSAMVPGSHTARFGEIEQRGVALTEKGRALYDHLVNEAWKRGVTPQDPEAYADLFKPFPDTWQELRDCGLAWFRYHVSANGSDPGDAGQATSLEDLIRQGKVSYEPLTYEDFLPLSAAGIFRSNLHASSTERQKVGAVRKEETGKQALQAALGVSITDEIQTYQKLQRESIDACMKHFGILSGKTM
ncbi:putative 2-oxoadipate dioxygenase/decarboxylase [Seiridium cardinale]|uniref:2-oxoadipate dioxygenase/decarboxylase n=1 Tax=Seiridium cardinale TaxID=138064 RepID=A0ABR2XB62_9PEZI